MGVRYAIILKDFFPSIRTSSESVDYNNGSQELSAELTLHSEESAPNVVPCSPASMVEVHRDELLSKG